MNNRRPNRPAPKSAPRLMVWKDQAKLDAQDPRKNTDEETTKKMFTAGDAVDPATVKVLEKIGVPAKKILHPLFGKKF